MIFKIRKLIQKIIIILKHIQIQKIQRKKIRFFKKKEIQGKSLPPQESFLYELFNQEEGQQQEEPFSLQFIKTEEFDSINEEQIKKFEPKTNFIKDVVSGEKQVYFFDIPQLGSQFGARFQIHNFLNSETFDSYITQVEEYQQKKQENQDMQQKIEEEYQEKLQALEPESQEHQDMLQEKQDRLDQIEMVNEPMPKSQISQYLVIFDNLGQDKYFEKQEIDLMRKNCLFLENKWNEKNYMQLTENIKMYKEINKNFDIEKFLEEEEQLLNLFGEFDKPKSVLNEQQVQQNNQEIQNTQNDVENLGEQNILQEDVQLQEFDQDQYIQEIIKKLGNSEEQNKFQDYYLSEFKFQDYYLSEFKFQKYLEQYQQYLQQIQNLVNLKFIKFSEVFQEALYLLNKHKNDVNLINTNIFDWRQFQDRGFNELNKLLEEYQYEGLKRGEFLLYNKVDKIQQTFEKFDEEKIKEFSYYMYIFLRLVKSMINLRIQNILKRYKEFQMYCQIREKQLQLKEIREEKKKSELKIAKEEFYASIDNQEDKKEEDEQEDEEEENKNSQETQAQQKQTVNFNEEEWENEWIQENPEIEIPKELEIQLDDDLTEQFFEELQKNDN